MLTYKQYKEHIALSVGEYLHYTLLSTIDLTAVTILV